MAEDSPGKLHSLSKATPVSDPKLREQAEQKAKAIHLPDLGAMTLEEIQHRFTEMQVKQLEMELKVDQLQNRLEQADDQAALVKTFSEKMHEGKNTDTQEIGFSSGDLPEPKQIEEVFLESENKFYLLTEEAPVSIMYFDKNGIVKFINKWHIEVFAKGMLGRDFFINKKITDLPGIQSAGIGPELEKILKGETVVLDQVHIPKFAVGHEGYQSMRGVPFFYNGEISGGILIREDITERKQAEKEQKRLQARLAHAQKLESVGRLAGGVAHDFNNKLSIINGYAEMAMDMVDPSEPLHETLREIHTAGKKSADIVRQLLAFARKQTISPVLLDLNDTISSMLKMLQRLIGENIDLAWHPGKNLWAVKIDIHIKGLR